MSPGKLKGCGAESNAGLEGPKFALVKPWTAGMFPAL